MKRIVVISIIFACLIITLLCVEIGRRIRHPRGLIIQPGAKEVKYYTHVNSHDLAYQIREPYPAKRALKVIYSELAKQGWKPLKEDFVNPGMPSSHVTGWDNYKDTSSTPNDQVRSWIAGWRNTSGDNVEYYLTYRWKADGPVNSNNLQVYAIYTPAKWAQAQRDAALKLLKEMKLKKAKPFPFPTHQYFIVYLDNCVALASFHMKSYQPELDQRTKSDVGGEK